MTRLRAIGPTLRVALGLAGLVMSLLLLADFAFDLLPDRESADRRLRTRLAESVTTQLTEHLRHQENARVVPLLDALRERNPELQSAAVRAADGRLLARSGPHAADWASQAGESSTASRVVVPILSAQGTWGRAEFQFAPSGPQHWTGWLREPATWAALALPLAGLALIYLYLRRTLQQLNPMTVVPERLRAAFDVLTEGVALLDPQGRVVLANDALRAMAGAADGALHGRLLAQAMPLELADAEPGAAADPRGPWQHTLAGGEVVRGVRVHIGARDARRTAVLNCSPILDPAGRVRGCLATFGDVTDIERSNQELRATLAELERSRLRVEAQNEELVRLATRDGLTGLRNRRAFFDLAAPRIAALALAGRPLAVMMLDVDHFKSFNDTHGHAVGDLVLQSVARQLEDSLRSQDLVARYGGEEFCVLLADVGAKEAQALAERVRRAVQADAGRGLRDGEDLTVTISVGLCTAPPLQPDLNALLKQADEALYGAKRSGRNRVVLATTQPAAGAVLAAADR